MKNIVYQLKVPFFTKTFKKIKDLPLHIVFFNELIILFLVYSLSFYFIMKDVDFYTISESLGVSGAQVPLIIILYFLIAFLSIIIFVSSSFLWANLLWLLKKITFKNIDEDISFKNILKSLVVCYLPYIILLIFNSIYMQLFPDMINKYTPFSLSFWVERLFHIKEPVLTVLQGFDVFNIWFAISVTLCIISDPKVKYKVSSLQITSFVICIIIINSLFFVFTM